MTSVISRNSVLNLQALNHFIINLFNSWINCLIVYILSFNLHEFLFFVIFLDNLVSLESLLHFNLD